jgi:hypothetical protein
MRWVEAAAEGEGKADAQGTEGTAGGDFNKNGAGLVSIVPIAVLDAVHKMMWGEAAAEARARQARRALQVGITSNMGSIAVLVSGAVLLPHPHPHSPHHHQCADGRLTDDHHIQC